MCSHEQSQVCDLYNGCLSDQRSAADIHFTASRLSSQSFFKSFNFQNPELLFFFWYFSVFLSCRVASNYPITTTNLHFLDHGPTTWSRWNLVCTSVAPVALGFGVIWASAFYIDRIHAGCFYFLCLCVNSNLAWVHLSDLHGLFCSYLKANIQTT